MSYRKHSCIHAGWVHVCVGEHKGDHSAARVKCLATWDRFDATATTLFDLDGESALR